MTPLLWAFPDDHVERFRLLLEAGADPNVTTKSDFGTKNALTPGQAVTHFALGSRFEKHWSAVLDNGGDPNLPSANGRFRPHRPLHIAIRRMWSGSIDRVRRLVELGANPDELGCYGYTAPMEAVMHGAQFGVALYLFETGADPSVYSFDRTQTIAHYLVRNVEEVSKADTYASDSYTRLVAFIEDRGVSMEEARSDIKRWRSLKGTLRERREAIDREVRERQRKEVESGAVGEATD